MTQREIDELRMLQLNMDKLLSLTQGQADLIAQLRQRVADQQREISTLRGQLSEMQQRDTTARAATGLYADGGQREETKAYLDEIIKEIECCMRQLSAM